jgi:thiol:disulfide interchange protein DsbA
VREQLKQVVIISILAFFCTLSFNLQANIGDYRAGVHYHTLALAEEEQSILKNLREQYPGQVLVLQFFSYGCGWCAHFKPAFDSWGGQLPSKVSYIKVPVVFHHSWEIYSRAFYTLEALDAPESVHNTVFSSIHQQRKPLISDSSMLSFLAEQGFEAEKLQNLYSSFGIHKQVRTATEQTKAFGISAIPQLIVLGPSTVIAVENYLPGGASEILAVAGSVVQEQLKEMDLHSITVSP